VRRSNSCWDVIVTQPRHRAVGFLGSLALPLVLLSSPSVAAEDDTHSAATGPPLRRELDGHNFIASRFAQDPFVSTYVGSETGFGYGKAPGRNFDLNGNAISTADYEVGAFAQYLDYQYGFTDWWAVRFSVRIFTYMGINGPGVAGIGSSLAVNPTLGTTVSFKVGEKLRLGGALDLEFGPSVFFNLIQAVRDSIREGEVTTPVNSFTEFRLKPAFVGAWAIDRALGLTFSLAYEYSAHSSTSAVTQTVNLLTANAMLDFDMKELNWVPIGLIAGFTTQFGVANAKFLSFRYNFGIFYTAVKPLNVGFEIVYNRAPVVANTQIFLSSLIGLLVIQYNFN
jgi:hypothetical protein